MSETPGAKPSVADLRRAIEAVKNLPADQKPAHTVLPGRQAETKPATAEKPQATSIPQDLLEALKSDSDAAQSTQLPGDMFKGEKTT